MKTLKLFTAIVIFALLGLTSCQTEENAEVGTNPNANSSTSKTAKNFERSAMNNGSNDDFLDDNPCTELLFPLTATINGQQVTLISNLDFSAVLNIMAEFNDDEDDVEFQFPIRVRTSNYSEVVVSSQAELENLKQECEDADSQGREAISCINIQFPLTILTYNISLEQTGSVVIQSEKQLYTFVTDLESDELFSVNYPINVTLSNGNSLTINNDEEFENAIDECEQFEDEKEEAEEIADEVESILTNSRFRVETFISAGVNTASDYADWTIDFTNDLKVVAKNIVNTTLGEIEGTYKVSSETEAFLNITFASNTAVSALSNDWVIDTYTDVLVTLKSKTDASVTLTFRKL